MISTPDISEIIRKSFLESLDVMGEAGKRAFIETLQKHGVILYDPNLRMSDLALGMRELFGDEITSIITENVFLELDRAARI